MSCHTELAIYVDRAALFVSVGDWIGLQGVQPSCSAGVRLASAMAALLLANIAIWLDVGEKRFVVSVLQRILRPPVTP